MYVFVLFWGVGCSVQKKTDEQTDTLKNNKLFVVDVDIKLEESFIHTSSVFNNVKTIILETTKNSLISPLFKFIAFDNYLFILNLYPSKDFLLFDRDGKFIRKIGGLGGGPGEYTRVFDFTIDTSNRIIYLLCNLSINKYSIDGTYIGSIRLEKHSSYIQYAHGKLLYADLYDKFMLKEIDIETGKVIGRFLENDLHNKGWNTPSFSYGGDPFKHRSVETPKFVYLFMDTIFTIHQNGPMPHLVIKSKHLTNNSDIKTTIGREPIERIKAIRTKNKIFNIHNYFETKNHFFFFYEQGNTLFPIFYCLETDTYKKAFLQNDLVFNEPILVNIPNFIFSDSNGVYECFNQPLSQELFLEWIKEGYLALNLDKRDQLMKLNEDSNPVIFYYSYDDEE